MLLKITQRIATSMLAFTRYRISLLGVRKFLGEVTGIVAIDEVIDFAAEHNEWVKTHENSIKAGLGLSLMARNSFLRYVGNGKGFGGMKILFSKVPLTTVFNHTKSWFFSLSVRASNKGVAIVRNGIEILNISVKNGHLHYSHAGIPVTAAVLAAMFGGKIPTTREEWEITGGQLAAQLADLYYREAEHELRERLHAYSPVTLISCGAQVIRSFLNEYPEFPDEVAVAIYSDVLSTESIVAGSYSIEGFTDFEGDEIIRINGTFFKLVEQGDAVVLVPAAPADGPEKPLSEDSEKFLYLLEAALNKVEKDRGVTLLRVAKTSRFISTPFSLGGASISLLVDTENPVPTFVMAEDSLFDTAAENLEDEIGEQELEMFNRMVDSALNFIGFTNEEKEPLKGELNQALPALGDAYKSGMFYLDSGALSEGMGKM